MGNTFYFGWEQKLIEWLQAHTGPVGDAAARLTSFFGELIFLVIVLGLVYWCVDKKLGKRIGYNIILACLLMPIFKNIFRRTRPYMDDPAIRCLKNPGESEDIFDIASQGYSLPSGHSVNAAAVWLSFPVCINEENRRRGSKKRSPAFLWVIAGVMMLVIGLSRIVLGVHYPTDVLAGWALGMIVIAVTSFAMRMIPNRAVINGIYLLIGAVGCFFCRSDDFYSALGLLIGFIAGDRFEQRFVKFKNTSSLPCCLLRLAGGGAGYVVLNILLKLPFSPQFLSSATAGQFAVRTLRYAVIVFVLSGVYPMCFRYFDRLFKKK